MNTLHTADGRPVVDLHWADGDLPALSRADRLSLRIGVALILRAQRVAERADRVDLARRSIGRREAAERDTFERRAFAAPLR